MGASPGGFGEWGHHQVALECGGASTAGWLWRVCASPGVRASTGGFGEWGHHQE